jgi:hypothetical protein
VIDQIVKIFHVPLRSGCLAGNLLGRSPPDGGKAAVDSPCGRIAKRAFYNGIVKNQQRSATEVWQIKAR